MQAAQTFVFAGFGLTDGVAWTLGASGAGWCPALCGGAEAARFPSAAAWAIKANRLKRMRNVCKVEGLGRSLMGTVSAIIARPGHVPGLVPADRERGPLGPGGC